MFPCICGLSFRIFIEKRVLADKLVNKLKETGASRWRAIAYPRASVIAYLRAHQNYKCVPPVFIHRAITCEFQGSSSKSLGGVV